MTNPFAQELEQRQTGEREAQGAGASARKRSDGEAQDTPPSGDRGSQKNTAASQSNPFRRELDGRRSGGGETEQVRARDGRMIEAPKEPDAPPDPVPAMSSIARSFNTGLANVLGLPADIANIPLKALGAPTVMGGSDDIKQVGAEAGGITHAPGEEPDGLGHRVAREVGSATLPAAGIMGRGGQVLKRTTTQRPVDRGIVDNIAVSSAQSPGKSAALEATSAGAAGVGGAVGNKLAPDDPTVEALGMLAGGSLPSLAMYGPTGRLARFGMEKTKEAAFPFTEAGGKVRAAKRLQGAAADPDEAARRVEGTDTDPDVPLTPARRTGDEGLLAIERAILKQNPRLSREVQDQLAEANDQAQRTAIEATGGDRDAPRRILERNRDYLVNLVDQRAKKAAAEADAKIAELSPDATPRQASRAARESIESALSDARKTENELWQRVDQDAEASLDNARQQLQTEIGSRSDFDDPADIPSWLSTALKRKKTPKLKDVQALRSRVLKEMREERGATAPNRNKLRILGDVEESLLEDMASAPGNDEAVQAARAFSKELNNKFTRGPVGKILGETRTGNARVQPEDTIPKILTGEASGRQVRQVLESAPEAEPAMRDYLRTAFVTQAMNDKGSVNPVARAKFFRRNQEVLDQLPGLQDEMKKAAKMKEFADRQGIRADRVGRIAHDKRKARTALYLDGPPREEMDRVLRSDNPERVARGLARKVAKDPQARQGIKTAFTESLLRNARTGQADEAGNVMVSGRRFNKLLNENDGVAKALGMTDGERARLRRIGTTLGRVEQRAEDAGRIVDDTPAAIIDLVGRVFAAQSGGQLANSSTGSSLVIAREFANRMRNTLRGLTGDRAEELLTAAVNDPKLYRELLTRPTDGAKKQRQAADAIQSWLAGTASKAAEDDDQDQPRGQRNPPRRRRDGRPVSQ